MKLYIDGDACPVKDEAIRVAARHKLPVFIVSNQGLRPSRDPMVQMIVAGDTFDAADDWIAERITDADIAITADILLAERCVKTGAAALSPTGRIFSTANIGTAVAVRSLNAHLRETGVPSHNPPFSPRDRSNFLQALENLIQQRKRSA